MSNGFQLDQNARLSVIIPVFHDTRPLLDLIDDLKPLGRLVHEIIVVDGAQDASLDSLLSANHVQLFRTNPERAGQMNFGAQQASGDILWFLHADTRLTKETVSDLVNFIQCPKTCWGRFNVHLEPSGFLLKIVAWFMNHRSALTAISTGDQGMFVNRVAFNRVGGFPSQLLMEDIELSKRLKRLSRPFIPKSHIITSSRKWQREGIFKTIFTMWYLRFIYWRGASAEQVHRIYYRRKSQ
ncbi:TIGR04283 family arsenosugar biosynthesis glycosyltransferase [Litoribacillus peritrichatus]|uniref:TIGR04283 family arsenosugar biosynthesis glycosyltransferase n=1 Tax=Litoribacillus peritrichatus TaxID=718191 RepID=UPI0031CFCDE3